MNTKLSSYSEADFLVGQDLSGMEINACDLHEMNLKNRNMSDVKIILHESYSNFIDIKKELNDIEFKLLFIIKLLLSSFNNPMIDKLNVL